ncbi:6,7-dimethyl-8-ribityllumazine synthase [Hyphobacterium sp. CCMP332]|nr:6,7-dimethyl-8-ribityllumazine synthase [Hyphobacterium sp. CCMP332]
MSSADKNLNLHKDRNLENISGKKLAIVVSEWNSEITEALLEGCKKALTENGARESELIVKYVPGSFELTHGSNIMAAYDDIDAVICLGCIIQGETKHFDFISMAVAHGATYVSVKHNKPVVFGVLTTNDQKQALERAGGKHGNKGYEAGITAVKMLNF